ncbi:MAG: phosphoribosyl-AMP cyclohydrolase [bacterium]|nr:phosphoribosyl-AMP cyclohydrolase [bacterium]
MTNPAIFADRAQAGKADETQQLAPKFDANGLITAVACDWKTNEVLMVAFMNAETLKMTIEIGEAVYWSRSRSEIWHKGQTSGNTQKIREILIDCDQDCLVLKVEQAGDAACHTGRRSCFYRAVPFGDAALKQGMTSPLNLRVVDDERKFDPEAVYGKK